MPLASQTFPSGSGNPFCPPGVLRSGSLIRSGRQRRRRHTVAAPDRRDAQQVGVEADPVVAADPQHQPRGVRLFAGNPGPARRASRTDEKNGKSGSTQSAQGLTAGAAGGCWFCDAPTNAHVSATAAASVTPRMDRIGVIL